MTHHNPVYGELWCSIEEIPLLLANDQQPKYQNLQADPGGQAFAGQTTGPGKGIYLLG
jgi:hypothetical protein